MTFSDLQKQVHDTALAHGWHDKERSFSDYIALFHSEISEAFEEFRRYGDVTKEVIVELADTVIRIMDFCERYEIDLESFIKMKDEVNQKRPYRHGNKAV